MFVVSACDPFLQLYCFVVLCWYPLVHLLFFCLWSCPLPCWIFIVKCLFSVFGRLLLLLCVYLLVYTIILFLMLFSMSTSGSVCLSVFFVVWYCRYASTFIDVSLMCHLLHVILLPFVVSSITYAWSWCYGGEASLLFLCCLYTSILWCSSSKSSPTGFLSITGMILWTGQLNINVARLGKPWPSGVVCILTRPCLYSHWNWHIF